MSAQHTPGPWMCDDFGMPYECARFGEAAYIVSKEGEAFDANEANARLIAAAPDLLKVCNTIAATLPHIGGSEMATDSLMRDLRAAIARATGEARS